MGVRYPRYIVTGKMSINDNSLEGVVLMEMGECDTFGNKGKKMPKSQKTHYLYKFEDIREAKRMGIPVDLASSITIAKDMRSRFLTPQNEEDNE